MSIDRGRDMFTAQQEQRAERAADREDREGQSDGATYVVEPPPRWSRRVERRPDSAGYRPAPMRVEDL